MTVPPSAPAEAPRQSLLPVFLIVLVDVFGMTLVLPLLAIYAESFDATPLQASMLVSVFALCQLLSAPLIGAGSDRIGRKPMLIASQIGTCIGFIILARANALWMVYLSRVIDGATAGNLSLAQSYIADHTRPEERTKAFGLIGIAFGVGFFIGPGVTGILSEHFGLNAPIWLAAALSLTSVLCTVVLLDNSQPKAHGPRSALLNWRTYTVYFTRPALRGRLVQFLFYVLSFSTFLSGFALFAERRFTWQGEPFGPREIGLAFAFVGFLGIIVQAGFLGRLAKRFGDAGLVKVGFWTLVAGFLALGAADSLATLALCCALLAFANAILRPALTSLISQQAAPHEQGVVAGLNGSIVSTASIIAPFVGGMLLEAGALSSWAWVAALMAGIGAVLVSRAAIVPAPRPA